LNDVTVFFAIFHFFKKSVFVAILVHFGFHFGSILKGFGGLDPMFEGFLRTKYSSKNTSKN